MLVDPLSVDTPFDWTILQKDQHRRSLSLTPGLTGIQSYNDWISQVVKTVQSLIRVMFRIRRGMIASSLSAVNWIRVRLTLYDRRAWNSPLALVEAL